MKRTLIWQRGDNEFATHPLSPPPPHLPKKRLSLSLKNNFNTPIVKASHSTPLNYKHLTHSQANNTSGWVQYPTLLIYFNSMLILNNVLNLLVGPMKVHDLLLEPRSLGRSKSEVLEVITAMLICVIITNLWLNKVRAKQRMCYKRTWKPAMRTQLLPCRTSNVNIWVHLMWSAFQSERSIVAQVCTQIDIRDKTKFFTPE